MNVGNIDRMTAEIEIYQTQIGQITVGDNGIGIRFIRRLRALPPEEGSRIPAAAQPRTGRQLPVRRRRQSTKNR